jgi:NADH dehydrogenase (ubiquinone) 1 alpha subcomplex subunit 5
MRTSLRLLAQVSRNTTLYAEPGLPTGLTGLLTHSSPRSTLLYLYSSTLDKLKSLPESSVYRQSTEALTKHRMSIIESIRPSGLSEWQQRVSNLVDQHPEALKRVKTADGSGDFNIIYAAPPPEKSFRTEDDAVNAPYKARPQAEGPREQNDPAVKYRGEELARDRIGEEVSKLRIEEEPPLSMEQVAEVEQKIGAGLIEEIIAVAEGEKSLAGTMAEFTV